MRSANIIRKSEQTDKTQQIRNKGLIKFNKIQPLHRAFLIEQYNGVLIIGHSRCVVNSTALSRGVFFYLWRECALHNEHIY